MGHGVIGGEGASDRKSPAAKSLYTTGQFFLDNDIWNCFPSVQSFYGVGNPGMSCRVLHTVQNVLYCSKITLKPIDCKL
jgi:hypothetical protein